MLRARLWRPLEPLQLLQRLLLGLLGHFRLLDRLAQLGDLGGAFLALAKFLLNLPQLLAQDVLALPPLQRFLRLLADLLGKPQDFDLLRHLAQQFVEPLLHVEGLEQILLLGRRQVDRIGDEIGERRGRLDLFDRVGKLFRNGRQERDRLTRPLLQLMHARLDLGRVDLGLADLVDEGDEERIVGQELGDAEAARASRHHVVAAVRRRHIAQDFRHRADATDVVRARCVDRGVLLQDHADRLVGLCCGLRAGN